MCTEEEKSKPKSDFAYHWSNENSSLFQTLSGGSALLVFLMTWLASCGSPMIVFLRILNSKYDAAYFVLVVSILAYLPWKKGPISNLVNAFARSNSLYYQKCSVIFQSKESLPGHCDNAQEKTKRPSLYAFHPHGAFCMGWSVLFCSKIMNEGRVRFVFSPILYASPMFRLWCRLVGCPGSASKAAMTAYMKDVKKDSGRPDHLALPPGGFEEATLSSFDDDRAYIKKRPGFIKLAMKHGYNVVPVYTFGENKTYWNMQGLWKFRLWLNSLGVPAIVVFGSWLLPLLPKRNPRGIKVVVGDALVLPTIPDPTREEVKLWHDKYIASLVRLFEDHKEEYYGSEIAKTTKLELW